MVAGADGDSHLVDEGSEVVVVDALEAEREDAGFVWGCAVDDDVVDLEDFAGCVVEEFLFVIGDGLDADFLHPLESAG